MNLFNLFFNDINKNCLSYNFIKGLSDKKLNEYIIKYKLNNISEGEIVNYKGKDVYIRNNKVVVM